jgi:hypothetical protein
MSKIKTARLFIQDDQKKTERNIVLSSFYMQETKPKFKWSLGYEIMFRQFPIFTVLPNLRKQMSLICLLLILKISEPKHWFHFILDALYLNCSYYLQDAGENWTMWNSVIYNNDQMK